MFAGSIHVTELLSYLYSTSIFSKYCVNIYNLMGHLHIKTSISSNFGKFRLLIILNKRPNDYIGAHCYIFAIIVLFVKDKLWKYCCKKTQIIAVLISLGLFLKNG